MQQLVDQKSVAFVDRRGNQDRTTYEGRERRQFSDAREGSSPEVRELAEAVDAYKIRHRRRFITFDELHNVITELGYQKST